MHQRRIRRPGGVSSTTVPFRYLASDRSEGSLHVPLFTDLANGFLVLTRYLRLADLGSNLHRGNGGVVRAGPVQRGSPPVSVDQIDNLFNGRVYVAARQDLHYRALGIFFLVGLMPSKPFLPRLKVSVYIFAYFKGQYLVRFGQVSSLTPRYVLLAVVADMHVQ